MKNYKLLIFECVCWSLNVINYYGNQKGSLLKEILFFILESKENWILENSEITKGLLCVLYKTSNWLKLKLMFG